MPRIRAVRRAEQGLSQRALGERVGASQTTIDRLEKGEIELTITWMQRLADALGCRLVDLLPESDFEAPALAEGDAAYEAPPRGAEILAQLAPGRAGAHWGQVRSDAVNLRGVVPGDYVIYEVAPAYRDGDLVFVNVIRPGGGRGGGAETLVRELRDGVLRPLSTDPGHRSIVYDPDDPRLAIMGRIVVKVGRLGTDHSPA